jgi:hypothetical protein
MQLRLQDISWPTSSLLLLKETNRQQRLGLSKIQRLRLMRMTFHWTMKVSRHV